MYRGIVFFDCDGVLTDSSSSWLHLHKYFGSMDNTYFARLYRQGKISYLDWMKIDVALMINSWGRPIKRHDVERALSTIKIRYDVIPVIKLLKQKGFIIGVISSGVDILVERVCREINADICLYNELSFDENEELIPGGRDWVPLHEKPFLIRKIAEGLGIGLDRVAYIGDSIWDKEVFEIVGLPIAVEPCGEVCRYAKYVIRSFDELLDIIPRNIGF